MATAEGVPGKLDPPLILLVGATSVEVSWMPPTKPNGIITHYVLHMSDGKKNKTKGLSLTVRGRRFLIKCEEFISMDLREACLASFKILLLFFKHVN